MCAGEKLIFLILCNFKLFMNSASSVASSVASIVASSVTSSVANIPQSDGRRFSGLI